MSIETKPNPTRQTSGPGVRTRRTKVTRHAYWVAEDDGGNGGWRFLPIDRAHAQMIEGVDDEGNPTRAVDLYIHKGFIPFENVRDEAALSKLPTNWRDVANRGDKPVFEKAAKDGSAA